jgi:hypothetical protein
MKGKIIVLLFLTSCFMSCSTSTPALYTWGNYSEATYNFVKSRTDADKTALIQTYEKVIKKQSGARKCVPPGIYADYGYLLIQSGQTDKGKEMLAREVTLYPESKPFIDNLLKAVQK